MKTFFDKTLIIACAITLSTSCLVAEDTQRERPAEWDDLVFGGRFMDRFEPMPAVGELTSDTWGVDGVKPRYVDNGIEEDEWSYWGGNIHQDNNGKYHLFVCRWSEGDPDGHMAWPHSEIVHAVSDASVGPFKVKDVIGPGHNPEFQQLADGSYFLYAMVDWKENFYHSNSLDGGWELNELVYDPRQRQIWDHMSNGTFAQREDGSIVMMSRGGGIWISKDGLSPFKQLTTESVYPPYDGRYEDPVIWKTDVQYHLIVNDWFGRIAYYMRSKDGLNWKLDAGEAYLPGIAKHQDGKIEEWYKFERIKVLQDEYGRAFQANFAVNDFKKRQDLANDNHSSKNIVIPLTLPRLIELVDADSINADTHKVQLRIKAEPGFNPQQDIDIESLRFGASDEVNFGKGCEVLDFKNQANNLLLTFSGFETQFTNEHFAAKLLGKTKNGDLLFGYTRLPWVDYVEPMLSSKYPQITLSGSTAKADIEIENFGMVKSEAAQLVMEFRSEGEWTAFDSTEIASIQPYDKQMITLWKKPFLKRNQVVEVRVKIISEDQAPVVLQGPVIVR